MTSADLMVICIFLVCKYSLALAADIEPVDDHFSLLTMVRLAHIIRIDLGYPHLDFTPKIQARILSLIL
jgi:hypothetical protein